MRPDVKKNVLVVDDEESLRKLIRLILERAGYGVLLAGNGQEALLVSRGCKEEIHLLLSDIEMPDINGITLGHQITAERPDAAVLLSSANPSYLGQTHFPFIAKPFTPDKLKSAIAETLQEKAVAMGREELKAASCSPVPTSVADRQAPDPSAAWSPSEVRPALGRVESTRTSAEVPAFSLSSCVRKFLAALSHPNLRWQFPHTVPAWAVATVALVVAIVPIGLHEIGERPAGSPYAVTLQAVRGLAGEVEAPEGKPLSLSLDVVGLPPADSYTLQIVNEIGHILCQKVVPAQTEEIRTTSAALRSGLYFVRVYGAAGELLKEFELRVAEKHTDASPE